MPRTTRHCATWIGSDWLTAVAGESRNSPGSAADLASGRQSPSSIPDAADDIVRGTDSGRYEPAQANEPTEHTGAMPAGGRATVGMTGIRVAGFGRGVYCEVREDRGKGVIPR